MSMLTGSPSESGADENHDASLVDALLVYAEPLAEGAHAVVIGDAESTVADRLFELGIRSVQVFDPDPARAANAAHRAPPGVTIRALVDELDVRDGAFDLAIVPDMAELNDPNAMVGRLRRAVAPSGTVIAMGRASFVESDHEVPFASDLGLATLDYAAFYELFAMEFDDVTIAGVVPFTGVVFAELGGEDEEAPPVSVDTRLAPTDPPSVFVVVASQRSERGSRPALDPYAIVQVSEPDRPVLQPDPVLVSDLTAMQLKTELLAAQLEEARERLTLSEARGGEVIARLERAALERDVALTRGMELEAILAASQQSLVTVERRLMEAERVLIEVERDAPDLPDPNARAFDHTPPLGAPTVDVQTIVGRAEQAEAALAVALSDLAATQDASEKAVDKKNADLAQLRARGEHAEAALASYADEVARAAEALAYETSTYEERLRDRARVIATLERELLRREGMIRELVASLEEVRSGEGAVNGARFEAPAPMSSSAASDEAATLGRKLDALALEVARREGELQARGWRITELENENTRLSREMQARGAAGAAEARDPEAELAHARDELDALRQALTQEHTARMAAESGEELARVRAELAHQAALLEQVRARAASVDCEPGAGDR